MIICMDHKMTANQAAKWVMFDKGISGVDFWTEDSSIEHDRLTDKERQDLNIAMEKQGDRVRDFLNISKIWR